MNKKVNYNDVQIARLSAVYDADASQEERDEQVKSLAVEFQKKPASIIAKLSSMKVYIPKSYKTKTGADSVRKGAIVSLIASAMGETEESFDTLVKANKTVLESIWNFVQPEESQGAEGENPDVTEEAETA